MAHSPEDYPPRTHLSADTGQLSGQSLTAYARSPSGASPAVVSQSAVPHSDDPPPEVPGYSLVSMIGRGGSSLVWSAVSRNSAVTGPVAVKVVTLRADAEGEIAALQGVRHPHVLRLLNVVSLSDHRLALVTDLLTGGTLADVVTSRGHLTGPEVVTAIAPLAEALSELHQSGIEHGDISPRNILLDRDGRPVLSDLGTVRLTGVQRAEVFGTAGFVDPVVLAGGSYGPPSDVYGLAAVAWFALTGVPPAPMPMRASLAELAPSEPEALLAAVEAGIDPDPTCRPTPMEFARALHEAASAEPIWHPKTAPSLGGLTHRIRVDAMESSTELSTDRYAARHRHRRPYLSLAALRGSAYQGSGCRFRRPLMASVIITVAGGVLSVGLGVGPVEWRDGDRSGGSGSTAEPGPVSRSTVVSQQVAEQASPLTAGVNAKDVKDPDVLRRVMDELAKRRVSAFADPQRAMSEVTKQPANPVMVSGAVRDTLAGQQDTADLNRLIRLGLRYRGLALTIRQVHLLGISGGQVNVLVRLDASAYDVVASKGRVVRQVPMVAGQSVRIGLTVQQRRWGVTTMTVP